MFWSSVKDSKTPAELSTYLTRYPNGRFAPLAQALLAHLEQQIREEQARVVAKQRQEEEARRTADLRRLVEELRARETERANAEAAGGNDPDAVTAADGMLRALAEVRLAREAAMVAQEQRLAAEQAAEEATKSAEAAISAGKSGEGKGDRIVVAALPTLDPPQQNFDGTWSLRISSETCHSKSAVLKISIRGKTVTVRERTRELTGRIDVSGTMRWTSAALVDGAPVDWSGRLQGKSGSGTYVRRDRSCSGVFTAQRG